MSKCLPNQTNDWKGPIFVLRDGTTDFTVQTISANGVSSLTVESSTINVLSGTLNNISTNQLNVLSNAIGLSGGSLNVQGSNLYWNNQILGQSTGGNAPTWATYPALDTVQVNSKNMTGVSSITFIDNTRISGPNIATKPYTVSTIAGFRGPFSNSVSMGNHDLTAVSAIEFQSGTGTATLDVINNGSNLMFNGDQIYAGQLIADWSSEPANANINANLNSLLSAQSVGIQTNGSNLNTLYTNANGVFIERNGSNFQLWDGSNSYNAQWSYFGASTNMVMNNSTIDRVAIINLGTSNYPLTAIGGTLRFNGQPLSTTEGSNWWQYQAGGSRSQYVDFGQMGISIARGNSLLYPESVVNTNIKMGAGTSQLLGPSIEMYPNSVVLGSPANPIGGTFSVTTGSGISWYSGSSMDFTSLQGFNFTGAGINLTGANIAVSGGGIEVTGGAVNIAGGLLNVAGGNVLVTSGSMEIAGGNLTIGSGLVEVVGGNVAVLAGDVEIAAGSLIIGTIAVAGAGVEIYGGDINIYQVSNTAAGLNVHEGGAVTTNKIVEGDRGTLQIGTPMSTVLNGDTVYLNHISTIASERGMNLTGVANIFGTNALPLNVINVGSIVATGSTPAIGGFRTFSGGTNCTMTNIFSIQNSFNNMSITGVSNITGYDLYINNPNNDLDINGLSSISCATGSIITGLSKMNVKDIAGISSITGVTGSQITGVSNINVTTINNLPASPSLISIGAVYTLTQANLGSVLMFRGSSATTMDFTAPTFTQDYYFTFINNNTSLFNMTVSVNGTVLGVANTQTSYTLVYPVTSGGIWRLIK